MPRGPYRVNQDRQLCTVAGTAGPAPVASLPAMTWTWQLEDPSGAPLDPEDVGVEVPSADNQGDAESWLGEHWRELLERGVATVTLLDAGERVYGPMGLAAT
jgi:hypothetical protein